jgi:1-deoxy-D-xylulose-5-phosphate reductoisomerase
MTGIIRLAVLGSTGSIGRQTLEIVRAFPSRFTVVGLAARGNIDLLMKQIAEFKPGFVCCRGEKPPTGSYQPVTMEEMASHPEIDTVVIATPGRAGLLPTLAAVRAGKNIALANKESLVAGGKIIIGESQRTGARILPVDSEHSAIWQCLEGEKKPPARIILTASGGPFRSYKPAQLEGVTAEQALRHPSWLMGKKVTVDSATLMNKGLEVIEAHWLFDVPYDNIEVLIHSQSIVHSIVEFVDGSAKAQLSYPDMRLPIQYALNYPERLPNPELSRLDWSLISQLDFAPPDPGTFPCLRLAMEAGRSGGTCPAVLSAANEIAVELFLADRIKFNQIPNLMERVLEQHQPTSVPTLEDIIAADDWARETAHKLSTEEKKS